MDRQKMDPTEEEEDEIDLGAGFLNRAAQDYTSCLLGKFLMEKPMNLNAMRDVFPKIWKGCGDFEIEEVSDGLYCFIFQHQSFCNKIIDGGPWSFDENIVNLKCWNPQIDVETLDFSTLAVWVQVRGLPFHLIKAEAGHLIGRKLGRVLDAEVCKDQQGKYLRIRVNISSNKALLRFGKVNTGGSEATTVHYKYERIPVLCFKCGRFNHLTAQCVEEDVDEDCVEMPYGTWLLANPANRRRGPQTEYSKGDNWGRREDLRGKGGNQGERDNHGPQTGRDREFRGELGNVGSSLGRENNLPNQLEILSITDGPTPKANTKDGQPNKPIFFKASGEEAASKTDKPKAARGRPPKVKKDVVALNEGDGEKEMRRKVKAAEIRAGKKAISSGFNPVNISPAKRKAGERKEAMDFTHVDQGEEKRNKLKEQWSLKDVVEHDDPVMVNAEPVGEDMQTSGEVVMEASNSSSKPLAEVAEQPRLAP